LKDVRPRPIISKTRRPAWVVLAAGSRRAHLFWLFI